MSAISFRSEMRTILSEKLGLGKRYSSYRDFSAKNNVSPANLTNLKAGTKTAPSPIVLARISIGLGFEPDYLVRLFLYHMGFLKEHPALHQDFKFLPVGT